MGNHIHIMFLKKYSYWQITFTILSRLSEISPTLALQSHFTIEHPKTMAIYSITHCAAGQHIDQCGGDMLMETFRHHLSSLLTEI